MKKRAPPAQPSLHRRSPIRSPKVEFVIACEGKATEPAYLRECIRHYGAGSVKLRILKETGVPLTLVKLAISEREALLEQGISLEGILKATRGGKKRRRKTP